MELLGHNQLVIRVQPDEGVTLKFGSKVPGTTMEVRDITMDFQYGEAFTESRPEAYERLMLDVLIGDRDAVPARGRGRGGLAGGRPAGGGLGRHHAASRTGPASGARGRPTRCWPATGRQRWTARP